MRTNIDIDDELLHKAMKTSHLKAKKAVLELALKEYVNKQARLGLLSLFGKVQWEGNLEQMRTDDTPTEWDQ